MPKNPKLPPGAEIEAEMAADETLGVPPRSPQEGADTMRKRVEYLTRQLNRVHKSLDAPGTTMSPEFQSQEHTRLTKELADAKEQLTHYETQLRGKN